MSPARRKRATAGDAGSVTPLVIGMLLCLLLLGAGVIAAGSGVLARRSLQSLCDGATSAVAGGVSPDGLTDGAIGTHDAQLRDHLAIRAPDVTVTSTTTADALNVHCERDAGVTFGALFGFPTVHVSVDSTSRIRLDT